MFYNADNATFIPLWPVGAPMPAPTSTAELLDLVRKSGLYEGDSFDNRLSTIPDLPEQPVSMASVLVKYGLITKFQAKLLLLGKYRGFRIGPYAIKEQIGQGGMGAVYLAEHTTLSRKVALKVLTPGADSDTKLAVERFLREARAAAALDHPNIVRLHDVGQFGTTYYIVMELVEGDTLDKLVTKSGSLPCGKAVEYIAQAASGLQHAYEKGFIHRDIKPQNLILSKDGTVKILDMGLARSSEERDKLTANIDIGAIVGTADYIAPEQAVNDPNVDIRADIYSLGATFYTLVTGRPPFGGNTTQKLVQHQVKDAPSLTRMDKTLPKELADVVSKMMAKKKEQRFRTPADVIAALTPWLPNSGKIVAGLTRTEAGAAGQETMENFVASSTKSLTKTLKLAVQDPKKKYILIGSVAAGVMLFGALLGYLIFGGKKAETANRGNNLNPVPNTIGGGGGGNPNYQSPTPRTAINQSVYRMDLTQLKPFRVRIKEAAVVEGERGALPQGVAVYAQGPGAESEFSIGLPDDRGTSIAMTHLSKSNGTQLACELEKPAINGGAGVELQPGVDYKLRIECRTDGAARMGVGIHTIVGYKPAAEYTLISLVKGDWQFVEIPFSRSDAGALRFVIENRGQGKVNTMFVRSVEVRQLTSNPTSQVPAPAGTPSSAPIKKAGTIFQFDPKAQLGMAFSVNGYDVESGTKPELPGTYALHCWKPGSKGEFRCEAIGGRPAIRFASRNEPCSAQFRIDVEHADGVTLQPGHDYEFRITYQTQGRHRIKFSIMSTTFDYLSGSDLPDSEGVWRTETVAFRRDQVPICVALNADAPNPTGFVSVAAVDVVDLTAAKAAMGPLYRVDFVGQTPGSFQILKTGNTRHTNSIGNSPLPRTVNINHFRTDTSGEYSIDVIDGTPALGVRLLEGTDGAQVHFRFEELERLQIGQKVIGAITYRFQGNGSGRMAFEENAQPYTKYSPRPLPSTGGKWSVLEVPFTRPNTANDISILINAGSTVNPDREKATFWIKSVELFDANGTAANVVAPTAPDTKSVVYELPIQSWKAFRFTSEGQTTSDGDRPDLPPGVVLQTWKPKSVGQFVCADAGEGPAVAMTNLNDDASAQLLVQLEYDMNISLTVGKKYAVRVEYRTANDGAGNVALQTEEYATVGNTPLDPTAGKWSVKELPFTRTQGKPIRITINSTGIGEGNSLNIRKLTVYEAK